MLRIHFVQHWFKLADEACEEALYDSASLRRFVGIDLGREPVPDATTMLEFRRLLNDNKLGEQLFATVGQVLQQGGFKLETGTLVDATIIGAPSSTKNAANARHPEMHQTMKGRQWYFGMKLHIGVDGQSRLAHSAVVTAANVHDKHPLPDLLHGNEQRVYGDSAYSSQKELIASKAPLAKDFTNERACNRQGEVAEATRAKNRSKSRIPARVEHVFCVVKRVWASAKLATAAWPRTPRARTDRRAKRASRAFKGSKLKFRSHTTKRDALMPVNSATSSAHPLTRKQSAAAGRAISVKAKYRCRMDRPSRSGRTYACRRSSGPSSSRRACAPRSSIRST